MSAPRLFCMCIALCFASRAGAYIDLAPTLGKVIRESQSISIVEVEKFSRDKSAVILKKVRDVKGKSADQTFKHQIAAGADVPRPVLEWAQPGQRGVLFLSANSALVCTGRAWYQVQNSSDGWCKPGPSRPDLPLAYCGTVSRLCEALELIVAGKTAVITTVPHGVDEAASFDLALNRPNILGYQRLQRIRANLQMPQVVMAVSASNTYVVGQGVADASDIPALIEKLGSSDATVRAESADDLRTLGAKAAPAREALTKLLQDRDAHARFSAAATLLRIDAKDAAALAAIEQGIKSGIAGERFAAARAAGFAGAAVASLTPGLAALLTDSNELTQHAAVCAIAAIGPGAIGAIDEVIKLLDNPRTASDASDALGRMGPAAQKAQKPLAKLLTSESIALRWAAVRGISQIGGPESAPAVQFMIGMLKNNSEVDGYNMMIYLGLIGSDAKAAIPAIQTAWVKQPALKSAVFWAIEPEKNFPWMGNSRFGRGGPGGDGEGMDVMRIIYECYVNELGERLKPSAQVLAKKILDQSAGDVPLWAYRILANAPADSVGTLLPGLSEKDVVRRENVVVALGYMGPAAVAAKPRIEAALKAAPTEREQRLIKWCLKEISR